MPTLKSLRNTAAALTLVVSGTAQAGEPSFVLTAKHPDGCDFVAQNLSPEDRFLPHHAQVRHVTQSDIAGGTIRTSDTVFEFANYKITINPERPDRTESTGPFGDLDGAFSKIDGTPSKAKGMAAQLNALCPVVK